MVNKIDANRGMNIPTISWSSWLGHKMIHLRDRLNPTAYLINALAYCLFPLAARCVVFTSSRSFKRKCQGERVLQSRETLKQLGGKEIAIPLPNGQTASGMYLDTKSCLDTLISKGARRDSLPLDKDTHQDILWIPSDQKDLLHLIEKMGVLLNKNEKGSYIPLGIPYQRSFNTPQTQPSEPGTVIYAPGSGHIFEFRRKTMGAFLIGFGMNVLVFHYSGTGKSEGSISEQATNDNLEASYRYLKNQGIADEKILAYGHCMGGGPVMDLGSKYPVNILADRTHLNMGEFAKLRARTYLHIPRFLDFLSEWIEPVMKRCFEYNNREKVKSVRGHIAIMRANQDEMIPQTFAQELFDQALQAKSRQILDMNSNHDMDLVQDEVIHRSLGKFLHTCRLLGYNQTHSIAPFRSQEIFSG